MLTWTEYPPGTWVSKMHSSPASPFFFFFGILHVLQIQILFFLRSSFDLLRRSTSSVFFISKFSSSDPVLSKSSSSSSFDSDLLFLLFYSFPPSPSSNLLLWNSSLSNSSSTWLNFSTLAVKFEFEGLDLVIDLDFEKLEMLVCKIVSNAC